MIKEAVEFARRAHEGAFRKGTNIPYITHPLETAVIVSQMTSEEAMITAALLHDTIEDAGVKSEDIEREFGPRVAMLVCAESEDKTKSWLQRKTATLEHLRNAARDIKILTLGDKLSNMRTTSRDYLLLGDEIWKRFNVKEKEKHAWYYNTMIDLLKDLSDFPSYQEYVDLCRFVFGEGSNEKG